jgi:hypothetical protein
VRIWVRNPDWLSQSSRAEICVLLPAPSTPEKLTIVTEICSRGTRLVTLIAKAQD